MPEYEVYTEEVHAVLEDIYDRFATPVTAIAPDLPVEEAAAAIVEGFCPRRCDARLEPVLGRLGCPACRSIWSVKFCAGGCHVESVEEGRLTEASIDEAAGALRAIIGQLLDGR